MPSNAQRISVDIIFLDLKNPRHKPFNGEPEVINYLCKHESVYALAKDIARIGLNPHEVFALVPSDARKDALKSGPFTVAEGNRRMCAIKLMNDPDLAPADLRADFRKISEASAHSFTHVNAIIYDAKKSEERAQLDGWLERIHGGPQGGIGRKPWNPEQKTRHLGDRKNSLAQSILDYAERRKLITPEQRKGRLTTAQRFLGNPFLREAIGIENATPEDVSRNRPPQEFDLVLGKFLNDLVENKTVTSRADAEDIKIYARALQALPGVSNKRIAGESLVSTTTRGLTRKPKRPRKPTSIRYEAEIHSALQLIKSYKLENLYFSICDLPLDMHTPLISVGVWAFFETLTARCGREGTDFTSYLGHNKLITLGFDDKDQRKTMMQSIERIAAGGNTTKHHDKSANFNGEQLANDMDVLKGLLVKLITEVKP